MNWKKFTLRETLILGFCATFIVVSRGVFRLHLNISGHAMFFTMFFLILGRACVPKTGASSIVGLMAGLLCVLLGMGKGGPLILLKFLLASVIVDAGGALYPNLATSYTACITIGAIAAASRFLSISGVEFIVGMEKTLILQHAFVSSIFNIIFGALGSAMVPPVVRRLKANQVIP